MTVKRTPTINGTITTMNNSFRISFPISSFQFFFFRNISVSYFSFFFLYLTLVRANHDKFKFVGNCRHVVSRPSSYRTARHIFRSAFDLNWSLVYCYGKCNNLQRVDGSFFLSFFMHTRRVRRWGSATAMSATVWKSYISICKQS